ncbi:SFRICE_039077, partial [Gryllus bimaculatus]
YAAVCLVLVAAVMGLYHACTRQNAVLAGFMVPALIMLLYLLWVLYSASRARAKQRLLQATAAQAHKIPKVVVQGPTPVRELEPEKIV